MFKKTLIFFVACLLFSSVFSKGENRMLDDVAIVNCIVFDVYSIDSEEEFTSMASEKFSLEEIEAETSLQGSEQQIEQKNVESGHINQDPLAKEKDTDNSPFELASDKSDKGDKLMKLYFIGFDSSVAPKDSVGKYAIISAVGKSISECIDEAQRKSGKTIFLGHVKMSVMSTDFAKHSEFTSKFFDYVLRDSYYNFASTVYLIENAEKFAEKINADNTVDTLFFDNSVKKYPIKEYYSVTLNEVFYSDESYNLPLLTCEKEVMFSGFGVIKNSSLAAVFDSHDASYMRLLTEPVMDLVLEFDQGDFNVNRSQLKISAEPLDKTFKLTYTVSVVLEAVSLNVQTDLESKNLSNLKRKLQTQIEAEFNRLVSEWKAEKLDVMNACRYLSKYHPKIYERYNNADDTLLSLCDINVKANVRILRNGVVY